MGKVDYSLRSSPGLAAAARPVPPPVHTDLTGKLVLTPMYNVLHLLASVYSYLPLRWCNNPFGRSFHLPSHLLIRAPLRNIDPRESVITPRPDVDRSALTPSPSQVPVPSAFGPSPAPCPCSVALYRVRTFPRSGETGKYRTRPRAVAPSPPGAAGDAWGTTTREIFWRSASVWSAPDYPACGAGLMPAIINPRRAVLVAGEQ